MKTSYDIQILKHNGIYRVYVIYINPKNFIVQKRLLFKTRNIELTIKKFKSYQARGLRKFRTAHAKTD